MKGRQASDKQADLYRFRSFAETAEMFGLSKAAMTVLAAEDGFPTFARRVSPGLMIEWLSENRERLRDIKVVG